MRSRPFRLTFIATVLILGMVTFLTAQNSNEAGKQKVRTVTVPISIYTKEELRTNQAEEYIQADRLIVKEDKEEQTILSIRSVTNSTLALAILIQDDITSDFNLQIPELKSFIRGLPSGTRVMVAYIRGGSLVVKQKFTDDLEKAAKSLTIVSGSSIVSGNGPYDGISDVMGRFDGLPVGRRAVLLVSDGYDSAAASGSAIQPNQSPALDRAISRAQKRSVAVYSIYSPTAFTDSAKGVVVFSAQGTLLRLSDETGGRAFYQGSGAPVSFVPFFKDLVILINRQFALTYLSTHMNKGYHKVEITSTNPQIKIEHPKGYFYR